MTAIRPIGEAGPVHLSDVGAPPPVLTDRQVLRIAGLDLRDRLAHGATRAMVSAVRGRPGATWAPFLENVDAAARQHGDERKHIAPPDLGLPPRAATPKPLTPAEIELTRRMDPGKLTDADVDLLLELQARSAGTDLQLVERVLGDAATKRFERVKAEYVADVKSRQPKPAGADPSLRPELERLLAERIIKADPELSQLHAVRPGMAEREAKALAKAQIDEAVASTMARWEAKVADAEGLTLPSASVVSPVDDARSRAHQAAAARPRGTVEGLRSA